MTENEVQKLIESAIRRERKLIIDALQRELSDNDPESTTSAVAALSDLLLALQKANE